MLKEAGSPLSEIRAYMAQRGPERFREILSENRRRLTAEREKLDRMERFLRNASDLADYAFTMPYNQPWLEWRGEEAFIAIPVKPDVSESQEVRYLRDHFAYCREHQIEDDFPLGAIVLRDTMLAGQFGESFYFTKLPNPIESERLYRKPAGNYAHMLHHGYYDTLQTSFLQMQAFLEAQGLHIVGDGYLYELIGHLGAASEADFAFHISIQTE